MSGSPPKGDAPPTGGDPGAGTSGGGGGAAAAPLAPAQNNQPLADAADAATAAAADAAASGQENVAPSRSAHSAGTFPAHSAGMLPPLPVAAAAGAAAGAANRPASGALPPLGLLPPPPHSARRALGSQSTLPATPGPGLMRTPLAVPRPEFGGRGGGAAPAASAGGAATSGGGGGGGPSSYAGGGGGDDLGCLWGTQIPIRDMSSAIARFFRACQASPEGGDGADAAAAAAGANGAAPTVDTGAEAPEPAYVRLVREAVVNGESHVDIDCADVKRLDPYLYRTTVEYPEAMVALWDASAYRVALEEAEAAGAIAPGEDLPPERRLQTRFYNLAPEHSRAIRDLDPIQIDTLVAVRGMVTRTGSVIPDLRVAVFRCDRCRGEAWVGVEGGAVSEPAGCDHCGARHCLRMMSDRSIYTNRQVVKMQEDPARVPEGETPRSLLSYAFDANVDGCKPGDKVTLVGIFRAARMRVNPRQRALHALFKTYLDVIHVQRDGAAQAPLLFRASAAGRRREGAPEASAGGGLGGGGGGGPAPSATTGAASAGAGGTTGLAGSAAAAGEPAGGAAAAAAAANAGAADAAGGTPALEDVYGPEAGSLTREELAAKEEAIRAMAADPDVVHKLVRSFAPKVIDMDHVKKGLLCQLFGGVSKGGASTGQRGGGGAAGALRGELNVLVVGDPSVSKSQLLGFVHHVAPRGVYTSGKGSSAVGLTAYVTKDPETGETVLESGALVLSDRGVCCIDEFDKMSEGARAMLHEVMEQQTVSIAKAGLVSQLNARTSVLACANPKGSRYLPDESLAENINLPPTLLSRFDLIYLVLDTRSERRDWALSRHLVSLFAPELPESVRPPYTPQQLREFIAFSRARIFPRFSDAAAAALVDRYRRLRQQGRLQQVVVATPRQLESLIRLSEALARMRLQEEVTPSHVDEAYQLWFAAMSGAAANESGQIDLDTVNTGVSAEQRQFLSSTLPGLVRAVLGRLFASGRAGVTLEDLGRAYADYGAAQQQQQGQQAGAGGGGGAAGGGASGGGAGAWRKASAFALRTAAGTLTDMCSVAPNGLIRRRA